MKQENEQTNMETLLQCLQSHDRINCIKLFIEENPDNLIAKDMLNDFLEIKINALELEKHTQLYHKNNARNLCI